MKIIKGIQPIKNQTDKIGLITDTFVVHTVLGYHNSLYQHVHNPAKCYPSLANGVTITGGAGAWVLGSFVEVIPVNTLTTMFDIHWIIFESASANDTYELILYRGLAGSEIEIGRIRTRRESTQSGASNAPIQIPAQAANTRISAKVASSSGGDNVTISVILHDYL